MKKSKRSKASSGQGNSKQVLCRVLCGLLAFGIAASFAVPLFLRPQTPEPAEQSYVLETAGSEIDFSDPEIAVHTAEDGIAIVNMSQTYVENAVDSVEKPDSHANVQTAMPALAEPAAPVKLASGPDEIWQGETAPTHGGFTMPVLMDGGSIGVLSIPGIGLSVRVYESDNAMEDMDKGVAHFKSTSAWEGNIGFSAHNVNFDGSAGYFYSLHTLRKGDTIRYETALGVREYVVESITEIAETDWTALGRTQDNRVTLITCISGKPALRLCVQAVEKPR